MSIDSRFTRWLWALVWRKHLVDRKVVEVKGWRTALVDGNMYTRETITPLFWWEA